MFRAALVSLFLVLPVLAQENPQLTVTGERSVPAFRLVRLGMKNLPAKTGYQWFIKAVDKNGVVDEKRTTLIDWPTNQGPKSKSPEFVAPPGDYRVTLKTLRIVDETPDWQELEIKVEILPPAPVPTPQPTPTPGPGPTPTPDPVPPTPTPDNPPLVNAPGLRILILEESSQRDTLTLGQREVLFGKEVRDWMRVNCVTEPNTNPDGAYRIWDKDWNPQVDPDSVNWSTIRSKSNPKSLPWMVITNGKTSYQGPVESGQKFLETANKYLVK